MTMNTDETNCQANPPSTLAAGSEETLIAECRLYNMVGHYRLISIQGEGLKTDNASVAMVLRKLADSLPQNERGQARRDNPKV